MSKYKLFAWLCPVFVFGEAVCELFEPFLMSQIIDVGIAKKDVRYITVKGILMIVLALVGLGCGMAGTRSASIASQGFGAQLREAQFRKIQNYSFSNIDGFSTASLVTRLTSDINTIQMTVMMMLRLMLRAPFMLVFALIMAISISPSLATVFYVAIPVLGVALAFIINKAFPKFTVMQQQIDGLNSSVQENLIAIRVVKSFVRQKHEKEKFAKSNGNLMDAALSAMKVAIWNMPVMMFCMFGCIIAIMWFGGSMIVHGTLGTGQLISFISYVTQILVSLMMISMVFLMLVRSKASAKRILEVIETQVDITDENVKGDLPVADGSVEFRDVTFKYNSEAEEEVLSDINIKIKSGSVIGIMGSTGSAKTTLVSLIPRLYDVMSGNVLVGGRDVRDYKIKTLRDSVAMVLQVNTLFSGTIKDNLKWGNENATDEQIYEACKIAQAHEFIGKLPDGYDTELGQGGVNISGGQKQRLCIARALLKNPKILILDDSTSAVDTDTDSKIRRALQEKLKDMTVIIIAQRISSVMDADSIVILDDGKINGIGSHEELLKTNEIYREVYSSQQEGDVA